MLSSIKLNSLVVLIISFFSLDIIHASLKKAERYYSSQDPRRVEKTFYQLMKSRYFFSALPLAAEYIETNQKITPYFEKNLVLLIRKTGIESLAGISEENLAKHQSAALSFVLGQKLFKLKQYQKVIQYLKEIPKDHHFEPETLITLGSAYQLVQNYDEAIKTYQYCVDTSNNWIKKNKKLKQNRYYTVIKEKCQIHLARLYYKQGLYPKALSMYEKINKNSYRWPYLLLEKAWAHYHLKDYNRSLGLLVTYKSPLLRSYFSPESEVLTALSYHRLCLWHDSLTVVDNYYQYYKTRSQSLRKLLIKNRQSQDFFFKMLISPIEKVEDQSPYLRQLMTQIRKEIKFNLDLVLYKRAKNELKFLKKREPSVFVKSLIQEVKESIKLRIRYLNHYIKKEMFGFAQSIYRYSYEMFNIKIQILSDQRDLIYKNKILVSNRSRGDLSHVSRTSNQHFWDFHGAFWADELGDYSFGLKSNCKKLPKAKGAI